MTKHIARILAGAIAILVVAVPLLATNTAFTNFVESHHAVDIYFPLVSGIVYALYRGYEEVHATAIKTPAA